MFLNKLLSPRAAISKPIPGQSTGMIGSGRTQSGQNVTADTAMRVATVYSCVRLLSESMAALPAGLYRRDGASRHAATDHVLNPILSAVPNSEMTAFDYRVQQMASLLLKGKSYSQVLRDRAGRVGEVWPLNPDEAELDRTKAGKLVLVVKGEPTAWTMDKVWRINGLTTNGIEGLSPIGVLRETVGTAMAMDTYAASIYGNGAKPGGVLQMKGKLSGDGQQRLLDSWNQTHGGANNANKVAVLQEGMEWKQISMSAEDAQFIESRKYTRSEICGIYGAPPHMVGDLDKATFSNIEHQGLQFVMYSLLPHITRFEQSIIRDLLLPSERAEYYPKFNVGALLRGDSAARSKFYAELFKVGAFSPNMILALEDENPIENGDLHFINAANITLEAAKNAKPKATNQTDSE
ncbi:phage portal protein [Photobacterium leiognathi]|uniref:phage portal protein n=1 Tax=Photobacterium leiognathi TaxID=553611 RepID=UPI000D170708|nr:phage portal protein [Photobacterium leiognathi]PSW53027.1 phage portal protein [Photobacterium leiognathi subsp. mandapamensis]